jgi:magnesium transporter
VGEILEQIDRRRIAELRREGRFFWVDVRLGSVTAEELGAVLEIPDHALRPLLDFDAGHPLRRKFHADGDHVVFPFSCFLPSGPCEVHLLVSGDYLLTLHPEAESLREALDIDPPEGRSEQYLIYVVLEALVISGFEALTEVEATIERLQAESADLKSTRLSIDTLRDVSSRLTRLRRRVAPERGTFARIGDEIGRVRGLEPDSERYFDRIGDLVNRLVEAIDAASDALSKLIDLRVNETIYWLTVVATVFLPLTFVTGFFGMNFGWMVKHITSPLAFLVLGVGGCGLGILVTLLAVRRRATPAD